MLGVDEGAGAAQLLHFGNDLQGERGFTRGLGPEDFDDPAARQAAHTERDIEAERPGGDDLDVVLDAGIGQTHDGALAELLFNLGQGGAQRLATFGAGFCVVHIDDFVHVGLVCVWGGNPG